MCYGLNWSFYESFGCIWYYPKPQGSLLYFTLFISSSFFFEFWISLIPNFTFFFSFPSQISFSLFWIWRKKKNHSYYKTITITSHLYSLNLGIITYLFFSWATSYFPIFLITTSRRWLFKLVAFVLTLMAGDLWIQIWITELFFYSNKPSLAQA